MRRAVPLRVTLHPELTGLCLTAPRSVPRTEAVRALRRAFPSLRFKSQNGLIHVLASQAPQLAEPRADLSLDWTSDALRFAENRALAARLHPKALAHVTRCRGLKRKELLTQLEDLDGVDKLDEHQLRNVVAMVHPDVYGLCVFDEQGAGKTVTFIYAFDLLVERNLADRAIVIAPKSMVAEWPRDFERFKGNLYKVATLIGDRRAKRAALASTADVIVTNYETAISMGEELISFASGAPGRTVLCVDESFYVKNLDARRTQAVGRLREWCGRAFVLCGTPAPNAASDVIQQFNLADQGATFEGVKFSDDRTASHTTIQKVISDRGLFIRHLKRDVLPSLPGKTFERVLVSLQPQQAALYREALDALTIEVRATNEATFQRKLTHFMNRRLSLLQLCSHPGMLDTKYAEDPAKAVAMDSILSHLIDRRQEKVVVWSFFTFAIEAMSRRYARYAPLRIDGSVQDVSVRRASIARFQEDEEAKLLIANPAAGGAGITLHRAHIAIYESMSNQPAHYLQSLDRIHRRGQNRPVEYLVLLCDGTVELAEYDRLVHKEKTAGDLLGDPPGQAVTRESFLADLLKVHQSAGQ